MFRTLWRVVPPLKLLPDEKWVWIRAAARAAQRLAAERRFDVLVSFAQPFSDHLVGLRVRRATGLPWVAHFSDPWTDSPYLRGARWQQSLWKRLEAEVVQGADALVFVNAQTAERVMRKYPDEWRRKAHVVPHGFDLADPLPTPAARDERLTIVHTGRFYDGIRTPEALLRALAVLSRRQPLGRDATHRVRRHADPFASPPGHVARARSGRGIHRTAAVCRQRPMGRCRRCAAPHRRSRRGESVLAEQAHRLSTCRQTDSRVDAAARRIRRPRPRPRVFRHRAGRRGGHRRCASTPS